MAWSGWSADCACGVRHSPEDPFLLTPNPMLPSRAGAYLLKATPRQEQERTAGWRNVASSKNATPCHVRACRVCGALYAAPEGGT